MKNIVEFPQLNTPYLIRRYLNGAPAKRYEPGVVQEIRTLDTGVRIFLVKFLYDGYQTEIIAYCGLAKELDADWVKAELKKKVAESQEALRVAAILQAL